jgi:structure-specific recognition protein 1
MGDQLDFDRVVQEYRGAFHEGQLKFHSNSFTFKNKKTNKSEQIQNNDIENLYWVKRAKGHCLKAVLKSGHTQRFDGFNENDYQKLDDFVSKNYKKSVEKTDMCVKGWNWGKPNFEGDSMNFEADGKITFELPLKNVSNTNIMKNEAILQFHQNDDAQINLMEIRFHVPNGPGDTDTDPAQDFINSVLEKADIKKASEADAICALTELNCITPRGRYDVKFFTDFVDLHGKTFDYKISYDHILRLFLLPHKDGRQMYFMMAMDPPIKQGNTRYPFLIVLFNIDDEIEVDLTVSEKTKEKFGDRIEKLDKQIKGPYHEVVSRICRTVLDKKITVPGNFTTVAGSKCYSCSFKASSGFLYPLERGFVFVTKPPLHILFSDISFVKFDRSSQGTRSFDFEIEHKNGTKYTFNGIEKTEQEKFAEFVKSKGINIAKSDKAFAPGKFKDADEDGYDPYAERMKDEGRQKDEDDDSDDDEEDEDFEAASESDDDIEYDSDASIDSKSSGDESGSGKDNSDKEKSKSKKKSDKKASPEKSKKSSSSKSKEASKRPSNDAKSDKTKKSKESNNTSRTSDSGKAAPKSAEFVEDDTDSD